MGNAQDKSVSALGGGRAFGSGGPVECGPLPTPAPRPKWSVQPLPTKEKHYVTVLASTDRTGKVTPLRIVWEDGRVFDVVDVLESKRTYTHSGRRLVTRYTIRVQDKSTFLFFEDPRWFVEAKVPPIIHG